MKRVGLAAALALALPWSAAQADTIKVGIISPYSGPGASWWAPQFEQALRVFQSHFGDTVNGTKIELIFRDSGGVNPPRVVQLAEELIIRERVHFLGGFTFTPNALAVAEIATETQTPTIIFNAATSSIVNASPMFVRTSFTTAQTVMPMAKWAHENGFEDVITLVADFAPGHDAEASFIKEFSARGGTVSNTIRIPLETVDFSPFFEQARRAAPDAIFVFGAGGPMITGMANAWNDRGLKDAGIELLGTGEMQPTDMPAMGDAPLGVVSAYHYTESVENELNELLWNGLREQFGPETVPNVASVGAFDGLRLIYDCVEELGMSCQGTAAVDFMRGHRFDSPRGPVEIDAETRDITQNVYIRRVEERDGKLINVNFDVIEMVPGQLDRLP